MKKILLFHCITLTTVELFFLDPSPYRELPLKREASSNISQSFACSCFPFLRGNVDRQKGWDNKITIPVIRDAVMNPFILRRTPL